MGARRPGYQCVSRQQLHKGRGTSCLAVVDEPRPGEISWYSPLGYQEYLAQLKDGSLWYFKIKVSGECQVTQGSDHFNPRPGGRAYKYISFKVVQQTPLDVYEKQTRNTLLFNPLLMCQGEAPLEESDIIFDILLVIATLGANKWLKVISIASLLVDILAGESQGLGGAVKEEGLDRLLEELGFDKFGDVGAMLNLLNIGSKTYDFLASELQHIPDSPEKRLLILISRFKYEVAEAQFNKEHKEEFKKALEMMKQKANGK